MYLYLYLIALCGYRSQPTAVFSFTWITRSPIPSFLYEFTSPVPSRKYECNTLVEPLQPLSSSNSRSFSWKPTRLYSTIQQRDEDSASLQSSSSESLEESPQEGQGNRQQEEDAWEYEEYEVLKESDFYNSEWKVGTLWDNNMGAIETTWCRLVVKEDQNVAIWGDGAVGKWSFDVPSQFIAMSKETFGGWFGKKIWAGVVDDFYFIQGTVRGWSPLSPASVLAQWQAKRLGVSEEESGIAPWFEEDENETDTSEESR